MPGKMKNRSACGSGSQNPVEGRVMKGYTQIYVKLTSSPQTLLPLLTSHLLLLGLFFKTLESSLLLSLL